jgi:dolichyl-phosphate beta-glucosyltransferase
MTGGSDAAKSCRVCLVVPCYNEARRLRVERFRDFLAGNRTKRILFVNDGSRDETQNLLRAACQGYEDRAAVLVHEHNKGKAEAVRTGINYALENFEQQFIGYWDADLATPLEAVQNFAAVLDDDPRIQMVFGARVKLLGRRVERRQVRHYLGRVFATVVSVMLRLPIYDTQCGAKLFRANDGLREVFSEPFLSRWVFDVEIIARYMNAYEQSSERFDQTIYEYPLEVWVDVIGSKVGPKDFFIAFLDLLRIRGKYL